MVLDQRSAKQVTRCNVLIVKIGSEAGLQRVFGTGRLVVR